uniref:Ixodegrin B n=1 Tax=Rhipicephalus zambeziensis TaxID=60191 RepID=A0A224Y9E3_9ACAR
MSWKVKHNAKFLLLILVISSACTELDYASTDPIVGRTCEGSDQCETLNKYCCVIGAYRPGLKGECQKRPVLGQRCSITMFRSNAYNNLYAPYVGACPCVEPRKNVCTRSLKYRYQLGVCQPW